jgi:serine protease Do
MIRKSLALLILGVATGSAAYAQQTPAPPDQPKAPRAFAFSFDGDGGYLGVQTQDVNKDNFGKYGLREVRGVAVEKVTENSPAAAAGIQNGDVIVRFNGEEITSVRKLTRLVGEVAPDHQAKVTVLRGGSERDITVTLGKRPTPEFSNGAFGLNVPMGKFEMPEMGELPKMTFPPSGDFPREFNFPQGQGRSFTFARGGRQVGISVTGLTEQLAQHFGVEGGVLISDVRENSPAARAGLKAADIVVEADGKPIKNELDLVRAINEKKEGDVQLTVVRSGKRQTISVTPEASKDNGFVFGFGDEEGPTLPPKPATPPAAPKLPAFFSQRWIL